MLDDGRITDSQGRTVDFKNTIIILTSNLGSSYLLEGIQENGEISEEALDAVDALLKKSFRPEFLNRLDEIVIYHPLMRDQIAKIVDLQVANLNKRLEDKRLTVSLTKAAKDQVIEDAYDPNFGARPIKRYLQRKLETMIAKRIIAGDISENTDIVVDAANGELYIQ